MILQIRTLHALCFLVVDCGHIDLGFMVHLTYNMAVLGIFDPSSFKKKYITSISGMLFLMLVQSLFQFRAKVGK